MIKVLKKTSKGSVRMLPSEADPRVVTVEVPSRARESRAAQYTFRPEAGRNYLVLVEGYNARTSIEVVPVGGQVLWQYSDGHGMCLGAVVQCTENVLRFVTRVPGHHGHGPGTVLQTVVNFAEGEAFEVPLRPAEVELLTEDEVWSLVQQTLTGGYGRPV